MRSAKRAALLVWRAVRGRVASGNGGVKNPDRSVKDRIDMSDARAAELAAELCAAHDFSTGQRWIAIAGPPGSGKTTLVSALVAALQARGVASVGIPMDGYHFTRAELDRMPDPAAAHRFRGSPFTFDGERFVRDVREARRVGAFAFPGFNHSAGDPVADAHPLQASSRVVLVEGNYLLLGRLEDGHTEADGTPLAAAWREVDSALVRRAGETLEFAAA